MGTRSRIAIRNDDGTYSSVYCHWDGYPSHHGAILRDHYTDRAKVLALIALGDLSSLASEVGEKHAFDDRSHPEWTTAYSRDRNEDAPSATSKDIDELRQLTQDSGGEWLYVFTPAGWQCAKGGVSAFGMPASKAPDGLESVDYWLQREAQEN